MSTGRKREDARRKQHPQRHCTEGHCSKDSRKGFEWAMCGKFMELVRTGKTPSVNCPYYRH